MRVARFLPLGVSRRWRPSSADGDRYSEARGADWRKLVGGPSAWEELARNRRPAVRLRTLEGVKPKGVAGRGHTLVAVARPEDFRKGSKPRSRGPSRSDRRVFSEWRAARQTARGFIADGNVWRYLCEGGNSEGPNPRSAVGMRQGRPEPGGSKPPRG